MYSFLIIPVVPCLTFVLQKTLVYVLQYLGRNSLRLIENSCKLKKMCKGLSKALQSILITLLIFQQFFTSFQGISSQGFLYNNSEKDVHWFKYPQNGSDAQHIINGKNNIIKEGNSLWFTDIEDRHSGIYSCKSREHRFFFFLEVKQRNETICQDYGENRKFLLMGRGEEIKCPGVSCYITPTNVSIRWYKNAKSAMNKNRGMRIEQDKLVLYTIYIEDSANFTCDYDYVDKINWTVRRVVKTKVIQKDTERPPQILNPYRSMTVEVELGKPFTLHCKVQFGFERNFTPVIKWMMHYNENSTSILLEMDRPRTVEQTIGEEIIIQSAQLKEVTEQHLEATFICFAQNSKGNETSILKLKKKPEVPGLLYIIIGPIVTVVTISVFSVVVYYYWIEILLIYRNYFTFNEARGGKEYDAFVSFASNSSSEEAIGVTEETFALHHLPEVLEQQCGYRLCLLERDVLPGGAYTEDIVSCIQRSRRAICILTPFYFLSPCLFELESALKTLLKDNQFKVIFIKFKSLHEIETLPPLVRKALKVFPALEWNPVESFHSDSKFWRDLKSAMSVKKISFSHKGVQLHDASRTVGKLY
ncbi:interleukin-18 receptor accessory protein isoform X2 [Lepisosteus oculatus]|uniref:interleukin-18 receptor accessory protein isoform X2 n=1 Tax=Lepisosteus oculatus TaxID=7918 RepID=UPI0007400A96|nr:PREDICTED: interleukin-18 receptor accessory protein isoform X2 [Lepisosteus oculatus]